MAVPQKSGIHLCRADKTDVMDEEQLPKFVRRVKDDDDKSKECQNLRSPKVVSKLCLPKGSAGLQENRIPEARRAYNEVLQFLPDDPTAHHGLAMAADLTENWAEAEDHYRQALRSRPRDANLLCDIGYSYLLQNRYSEAASYLAQAVQINPNHENAHANLALLDVRQGNREAARERLTQRYGDPANVTQILASLESNRPRPEQPKVWPSQHLRYPRTLRSNRFVKLPAVNESPPNSVALHSTFLSITIPQSVLFSSTSHTNVPGQDDAAVPSGNRTTVEPIRRTRHQSSRGWNLGSRNSSDRNPSTWKRSGDTGERHADPCTSAIRQPASDDDLPDECTGRNPNRKSAVFQTSSAGFQQPAVLPQSNNQHSADGEYACRSRRCDCCATEWFISAADFRSAAMDSRLVSASHR